MKTNLFISLLTTALAALSLSGCRTLYGQYERPGVQASGLVRSPYAAADTLAVSDTTTFASIPWRSVFTDPQLQSLIEKGLTGNADLLNAALNVQIAEAQLKAARLSFLPSFHFTPQGTISSWDGSKATKTYSLPVNAAWSVDLFGNLLSSKRAAQVALLQTKDYQVAVQTNLIANIANLYYTLLMLDRQLELLSDMERLAKETWDIMLLQKDAARGVRSTAVQAAESNYYSIQTQRTDMVRQIRETENSLSLLVGQQAQTIARGRLEDQSLPTSFATGVSVQLLNNRADVHAAEMALAQCFYNVQQARSQFYPALNISASGAFTNDAGSLVVNPGKILLTAVASLTQPIFQNGKLRANLKVAQAQYEQARHTWQNALLSAGAEVSNALVLYNSSAEKSAIEARQIAVLRQNVDDTRELMATSGSTYLEVITAQSSLLNVELSKVSDDFYKMQAVVNLYYALGGGAR